MPDCPLIKLLNRKYEDCYFYLNVEDDWIELLYSNQKYQTNEKFLDEVFDMCFRFLTEDEMWKLATCYDLNDEIPEEYKTKGDIK